VSGPIRVLAVADSDSYVKWGAALVARMPPEWEAVTVLLASPVLPSANQLSAALGREAAEHPAVLELRALGARVAEMRPDVVLLSLRGPLVKVVVRTVVRAAAVRPILVTGLPGISIPANRKAIAHRAQADLFVLHSHREVREFSRVAEEMGIVRRFALATLPFLPDRIPTARADGDVIFAAQAKVPREKRDRVALLSWLAESARRHPYRRVVVKVRAERGEQQTHFESHDYADLIPELSPPPPPNLVVAGGAMEAHLAGAAALVTVSSTAAIEAVALGVPTLVMEDFGVSPDLINTVFEESGLLGNCGDLVEGRFKRADAAWRSDNYFHDPAENDWVAAVGELLDAHRAATLPLNSLTHGLFGGPLRRAWDRKRALGRFDRSWSGRLALAVGMPARWALVRARRVRRWLRTSPVA
jgi:hypothetical protein